MYKPIRCLYAKREVRTSGDFRGEDCLKVLYKHCNLIEGVKLDGTEGSVNVCSKCDVIKLIDDYVELISDLIREVGEVRQVDMAARLGVSQPTVAKMLKRLATVGLIQQIPWRGVFLTPEGEKLAQMSRERHQIVENFFLALGISAETARIDAEGVEHHVSEETLAAFSKFCEQQGFK